MTTRLLPFLLAPALALAACTGEASHEASAAEPQAQLPADAKTYEIGCYGCVFEAEGAQGCEAAILVDGKPVRMTGNFPNAHAMGLCDGAKEATVAGHMEGDTFVATAFSLN